MGLTEAEVHQFLATIILGREPLDVVDLKTVSGGLDGVALVLPWTLSLAARSGHVVHLKNMLLNEDAPDLAS